MSLHVPKDSGRRPHFAAYKSRPHIKGCDQADNTTYDERPPRIMEVADEANDSQLPPTIRLRTGPAYDDALNALLEALGMKPGHHGSRRRYEYVPGSPASVERSLRRVLEMAVAGGVPAAQRVALPGQHAFTWEDMVVFAPDARAEDVEDRLLRAYWGCIRSLRSPTDQRSAELIVGDREGRRRPRRIYVPTLQDSRLREAAGPSWEHISDLVHQYVIVLGRVRAFRTTRKDVSADPFYIEQQHPGGLALLKS